jgi:hypothetical protein
MRQLVHTTAPIQGTANHTPSAKPMRSGRIAMKVCLAALGLEGTGHDRPEAEEAHKPGES